MFSEPIYLALIVVTQVDVNSLSKLLMIDFIHICHFQEEIGRKSQKDRRKLIRSYLVSIQSLSPSDKSLTPL